MPPARGGRLGHALLLGESPRNFYLRRRGESEVVLGTHLLDLVWLRGKLGNNDLGHKIFPLQEQIGALAGEKFHESCIARCHRAMFQGEDGIQPVRTEEELLGLLRFRGEAGAFVTVRAGEGWMDLLEQAQRLRQEELTRRRICIEANPTSNLIVGDYADYAERPYRNLVGAGLSLALNTDDPGLFVCSLPGEFSALYKAPAKDLRHREALDWPENRAKDAANILNAAIN